MAIEHVLVSLRKGFESFLGFHSRLVHVYASGGPAGQWVIEKIPKGGGLPYLWLSQSVEGGFVSRVTWFKFSHFF